jgi:hypothetical protein
MVVTTVAAAIAAPMKGRDRATRRDSRADAQRVREFATAI